MLATEKWFLHTIRLLDATKINTNKKNNMAQSTYEINVAKYETKSDGVRRAYHEFTITSRKFTTKEEWNDFRKELLLKYPLTHYNVSMSCTETTSYYVPDLDI